MKVLFSVVSIFFGLLGQTALSEDSKIQLNLDSVLEGDRKEVYGKSVNQFSLTDHWLISKVAYLKLGRANGIGPSDLNRLATEGVNQQWARALDTLERVLIHRAKLPRTTQLELMAAKALFLKGLGLNDLAAEFAIEALQGAKKLSREAKTAMNQVLMSLPAGTWRAGLAEISDIAIKHDALSEPLKQIRSYFLAKKSQQTYEPEMKDVARSLPAYGLLMGVHSVEKGDLQKGLNAFQTVRNAKNVSSDLKDLALLNIGRTLYEARYYKEAAVILKKISKGTEGWAYGREEAAWAELHLGNYNNALAISTTFETAFFDQRYLPGFDVVRTAAHLKRCEYKQAANAIKSFKTNYISDAKWYEREGKRIGAADWMNWYFGRMTAAQMGNMPEDMNRQVRGELVNSRVLARLNTEIAGMKKQIAKIDRLYAESPRLPLPAVGYREYYQNYKKSLNKQISLQEKKIGVEVRTRMKELNEDLSTAAEILLVLDFELIDQLRKLHERVLAQGMDLKTDAQQEVKASANEEKWPFEAEAWYDELDQYKFGKGVLCGKTS